MKGTGENIYNQKKKWNRNVQKLINNRIDPKP